MVKRALIAIGAWSFILTCLALLALNGDIYGACHYYSAARPFFFATAICFVIAASGLLFVKCRPLLFWMAIVLHLSLIAFFAFALFTLPHADRSVCIAWAFLAGGGSLVACLIALGFGFSVFQSVCVEKD